MATRGLVCPPRMVLKSREDFWSVLKCWKLAIPGCSFRTGKVECGALTAPLGRASAVSFSTVLLDSSCHPPGPFTRELLAPDLRAKSPCSVPPSFPVSSASVTLPLRFPCLRHLLVPSASVQDEADNILNLPTPLCFRAGNTSHWVCVSSDLELEGIENVSFSPPPTALDFACSGVKD